HALGAAPGGHEGAAEDEEGNRQQGEVLGRLVELEGERGERIRAEKQDGDQRGQPERDRDRHAHEQEHEEQDEEHRGGHRRPSPPSSSRSLSASSASSASRPPSSPRTRCTSTSQKR